MDYIGFRVEVIVENQMKKQTETEMEAGIIDPDRP